MTEHAPSVGSLLRQRRQMRGQSLEAVHQSTRIPRGLLQALEEDRFADFPAPVYLRGFLKSYCEHLDIEFEPLWQRAMPPPQTEDGAAPKPRRGTLPMREWPSLAPVLVVGGLVVAGIVAWGLAHIRHRPQPGASAAPATPAFKMPSSSTTAAVASSSPVAAISVDFEGPLRPERIGPQRLLITATAGGGFVRLSRDGKLVFEGRLPAGKYLDWRGNSFELRASNPGGLRVSLADAVIDLTALKPEPDGSFRLGRK